VSAPSDDEEARAAAWRQSTINRVNYAADVWASLQAPPEPRQAVMDAWSPVLLAQLEAEAGPTDPEDDP
jgi:hypothetical protein